MRFARGLLIVTYGLFTIAAQALLFREFVTAFEGNDISVGVFFGSWFLWIGAGAMLVRRWGRLAEALLRHIELLLLIYVPALAIQLLLIVQVRRLAGLAAYDLMSIQAIVFWSLLVNAPVSLVTGLLFPLACRWIEQTQAFPVSRVYVLEAVGSFLGGIAVTVLLAWHVDTVRILFLVTIALAASVLASSCAGSRRRAAQGVSLVFMLLFVLGLAGGIDGTLARQMRLLKWTKLLPPDAYRGALQTAQAEYLYGQYQGQWVVVRDGAACEALPNEAAGQAAAVALCQRPDARRVLVIGSGLGLCDRLLTLPQIENVAWAHADSEYVARIRECVPEPLRIHDGRFMPIAQELRRYLAGGKDRFDLVILNLPDVTSSASNRYFTAESFARIRTALAPGGVLSVSVAGGENVMGAELAALGASVKLTLEKVFSRLVIVPGDQTWLLASDSEDLTGDPAALRDRFAAIKGAEQIFPPAGLLSIYLPDRAAQAMARYEKVDLPAYLLVNRDWHPLTHLYSLLLAARQSGASVTRLVRLLALGGLLPFFAAVLVFVALRVWSMTRRPGEGKSSFDASFLLFSTGWVSIAVVIVLMYLYETRFGSLYLHVGLISSLFMVGLTLGAILVGRLIKRETQNVVSLLVGLLALHVVVLVGLVVGLPRWQAGHGSFAAVFVVCGLCCGGYWPLAAAQLSAVGFHPGEAGSRLETADHLGACVGGLAVSLLMLPVLGSGTALLALTGLLLANVPAAVAALQRHGRAASLRTRQPWVTYAGYALFGIAAWIVISSDTLTVASARLQSTLPEYAVQTLAGGQDAKEASVTLPDSGKRARYFILSQAGGPPGGYVLSSADFAPAVRGFGGKINLAMHIDDTGSLVDFLIVQSNETPTYLDLVRPWLLGLKGKNLFVAQPFTGVNAVTGATISSEAILAALQESSRRFAAQVLSKDIAAGERSEPASTWRRYVPDLVVLYLPAAFTAAILVTLWGGFWSRLAVLVLTFVLGGLALNAQYSSEQIVTLLSLEPPAMRLTGTFLLVLGVPLLVILFGNLYCGYVCPFGAAQELLGYLLPRRLKPTVPDAEAQPARFVRYIVLCALILVFFLSRDRTTLSGDPLIRVFSFQPLLNVLTWPAWMWLILIVALAGSVFVVRFWCRYLCPVGAFLSLLNHFRLLRRWLPAKRFGRCEFGLTASEHVDCIACDRCRYSATESGDAKYRVSTAGGSPYPLLAVVLLTGGLVAGVCVNQFRRVMPTMLEAPAATVGVAGQPRDVDLQRIRTLIEQGRLSNKEAEHYKKLDETGP
jgi:spermidine synthase/Na+-translocating ferredoxin:NAD+ oxidoreductase RnfG subunit